MQVDMAETVCAASVGVLLQHQNGTVREQGLRLLLVVNGGNPDSLYQGCSVASWLVEALEDEDWDTREVASKCIANIPRLQQFQILSPLLKHHDFAVRANAVRVLSPTWEAKVGCKMSPPELHGWR